MRHGACALLSVVAAAIAVCGCGPVPATRNPLAGAARQAQVEIDDATRAVDRMWMAPGLAALLRSAKGVLVVPVYGRGAYFLRGQGGQGVLLLRTSVTEWSQPAFYALGGAGFGLQAANAAGPIALLLMTDAAVGKFRDNTRTWALDADTGLQVLSFSSASALTRANAKADIIIWSGAKIIYGGISAAATYITPSATLDDAYYQDLVTNRQILTGAVQSGHTARLRQALAGGSSGSYR